MRRFCYSLLISVSIFLVFAVPALAQSPVITITTGTVGEIIVYGGQLPLENHIVANGSSLNQTTYNELFQAVGCSYGCDATTFDIPDLRNRFVLGRADSYFTCGSVTCLTYLGDTGGLASVALTIDEMPSHNHQIGRTNNYYIASGTGIQYPGFTQQSGFGQFTFNQGGTSAHNNIPPYVALSYLIRYQQDVITFTVSSTATPTPTSTPTPTATPTGTVTIYLPNVDAYTHTLGSGKILSVPIEISFGQLFISGAIISVIGVVAMRVLFGGMYRE